MGTGERVFGDAGREMGNAQVGREYRAESGDDGTKTDNVQVGRGPHEGAGTVADVGAMTGLVL